MAKIKVRISLTTFKKVILAQDVTTLEEAEEYINDNPEDWSEDVVERAKLDVIEEESEFDEPEEEEVERERR